MSSFFGKAALNSIEKDIRSEISGSVSSIKSAFNISKSPSTAPTSAFNIEKSDTSSTQFSNSNMNYCTSSSSAYQMPNSASVDNSMHMNWANFNYPPYIRIVHFSLSELPSPAAYVCKFLHINFLLSVATLIVNFVHTCILAIGGVTAIRICYSLLNIFILVPFAGYSFYKGYKGIAISSPSHLNRYFICNAILLIISFYFILSPLANSNGFLRFTNLSNQAIQFNISSAMKGFWTYAIFIESLCWLSIVTIGGYGMYLVYTFNPYHSQQARSRGPAFS